MKIESAASRELAAASIVSSDDEYVGVTTAQLDVGSSPVTMTLRNQAGVATGTIVLQRKTDVAH